jgi:ABC-type lipoprotein release transport system permease subunit
VSRPRLTAGTGAVWRAARAAVRRRRLQTFVIGLVVLLSTTTLVVALALLDASSAPFDRAFAQQRGAHAVTAFDSAKVTVAQLTAQRTGVTAAAGPFGQVTLNPTETLLRPGPMTVVGRADPGGPVDRIDLWHGHWPSAPGEIVLNFPPGTGAELPGPLADPAPVVADGHSFTVVGYAYSLSRSADGWVTPAQMADLHPTTWQMLYRFSGDVSTRSAVQARVTAVTAGLPAGAFLAAEPYLVAKERAAKNAGVYVPFLATFGVLGLVVAVLIVGNVVSGAVISGFQQIGIMKAIGFTPRQVVLVHLLMVSIPSVAGCVLGTVAGTFATRPLLSDAFDGLGFGAVGVSPWVWVVALLGVPALVLLTAFVPASRAHRLSAAEAVSAGAVPRGGHGRSVQRWLSGLRLPRSVSLGLGLPFARPARTAMTLAAILLGVTTVTFASGIAATVLRVASLSARVSGDVDVMRPDAAATSRSDTEIEAMLRGLPGTARVATFVTVPVAVAGQTEPLEINFGRGDVAAMGYEEQLLAGRWPRGSHEAVVPTELMRERGLTVGQQLVLDLDGHRTTLTIVGQTLRDAPGPLALIADRALLTELSPDHKLDLRAMVFQVQLKRGVDHEAYARAVRAADPGLDGWDQTSIDDFQIIVISISTLLSILLAAVAGLGVLNTVVLNVRERRRDLGMLKSIGMTPRQVVAMVVTSMAALGLLGGLLGIPIGIAAHRFVVPMAADAANIQLPGSVFHVWPVSRLALLVLAGTAIAVLGALLPARSAARLTIARVLHNE